MRVLQKDYDAFYKDVMAAVAGYKILSGCAASCTTPPRTVKEKIQRKLGQFRHDFYERLEPHDEDLTLYGETFGSYIDINYKEEFIKLKKKEDWKGIESLTVRVADKIKKMSADYPEWVREYLSCRGGRIDRIERKLSLMEKIKNFFI